MNDLERALEKLQNSSHHTKRIIMWIGVPVIMAAVVFIWLTFSDFGYTTTPADQSSDAVIATGPSNFEIFKNGLGVSVQSIQSLIQSLKDKISQTNSFDVKTIDNSATTSLNISEASSTLENYPVEISTSTLNQ